jgi:hypothetical protein
MKKLGLFLITVTGWLAGFSQSSLPVKIDSSRESVLYWSKWSNDLYDKGVDAKKDSFFVKEEVVKLLKDSAYRREMYPAKYEWTAAIALLQRMELKKAFWYMINIYKTDTQHRDLIVGTFALYDSLIEMDKILISTYYTYAFPDPRVCRIVNGKPEIYRPDILEDGLRTTKEIAGYLWAYREKRAGARKTNVKQ